jgi:hypothetical protein
MRTLSLVSFLLVGCAPSLVDDVDGDTDAVDADTAAPPVDAVVESYEDGSSLLMLDATHERIPVLLDLDTGFTTLGDEWDVSIVRFDSWANEDVSIMALVDVPFDEVVTYDDADWVSGNEGAELFADWWLYDITSHIVTPADITFAVLTNSGDVFKLRFVDYYADAGTPGTVSMLVAPLEKTDD